MDRLAMYLRLSLEDKKMDIEEAAVEETDLSSGEKTESSSIGSQRKQILEYIRRDPELSKYEIL